MKRYRAVCVHVFMHGDRYGLFDIVQLGFIQRERHTHKVNEIKKNNMSVLVDIFDVSWCREERRERERLFVCVDRCFISKVIAYRFVAVPVDVSFGLEEISCDEFILLHPSSSFKVFL